MWMAYRRGWLTQTYSNADWLRVGRSLSDLIYSEPRYLRVLYRRQRLLGAALRDASRRMLTRRLPPRVESLLEMCATLQKRWIAFDQANVLPWHVGSDSLRQTLGNELKQKCPFLTPEDLETLTTPAVGSFERRESRAVLSAALVFGDQFPNGEIPALPDLPTALRRRLKRLSEAFGWIPFGYDGPSSWNEDSYRARVVDLLKRSPRSLSATVGPQRDGDRRLRDLQHAIRVRRGLQPQQWRLCQDLQLCARMTNERKEATFPAHMAYQRLIAACAQRLGVSHRTLQWVTLEELRRHCGRPAILVRMSRRRREGSFVVQFKEGSYRMLAPGRATRVLRSIRPGGRNGSFVVGDVGSIGPMRLTRGSARVILSARDIQTMRPGEVLVTQMTSPEFVPAMREAAAIVTDEGGTTCHAAIVSRELRIPCLIGTRDGTRTFRTGDLLEVDTANGMVRKL